MYANSKGTETMKMSNTDHRMTSLFAAGVLLCSGATILQAADTDGWETEFVVGLDLTSGNSETLGYNGGVMTRNITGANETSLSVDGTYAESTIQDADGADIKQTTTEALKGAGQYNRLLTERDFLYAKGTYLYDSIADVDYRVTAGPGVGHYLIKSDASTLSVEVGLAYLSEKVGGVEDDAAVLRVAQRGELKLSETSRVWESVEYLPKTEAFDEYLMNAEVGADAALNGSLTLRLTVTDRYNSTPAADLESNDLAVKTGLVCKF
jgi:putative salt-induced outer membrane protein YdiY